MIGALLAVAVAVNPVIVTGWNASPVTVQTGQQVTDRVRVKPKGKRTVILQVSAAGSSQWRRVWKASTTGRGRVTVRFPALAEGPWDVRLKVPATRNTRTVATPVRRVVVSAPGSVPPTPSPTPTPTDIITAYATADIGLCPPAGTPDRTAALVDAPVIVAGDLAYPTGTTEDFATCYDPFWGALKETTFPVPGNHEYMSGAAAYFAYFGDRVGTPSHPWYAIDLGPWRFYMLNSNCASVGGCGAGSSQYAWLAAQLAQNQPRCTAAVWHHPRWSSGQHGPYTGVSELYALLAAHGTDLLLTGHEHNYERFAAMSPAGTVDQSGIREFVVGTGGQTMRPFAATAAGSQVRLNDSAGVLRMELAADGYAWEFLPVTEGAGTDAGADTCR